MNLKFEANRIWEVYYWGREQRSREFKLCFRERHQYLC